MKAETEGKEESHGERDAEDVIQARPDEVSFYCGEDLAG